MRRSVKWLLKERFITACQYFSHACRRRVIFERLLLATCQYSRDAHRQWVLFEQCPTAMGQTLSAICSISWCYKGGQIICIQAVCSDPLPTWLLKEAIEILAPCIINVFNMLLTTGQFPSPWRACDCHSLGYLEKAVLDETACPTTDQSQFSNFPFLSKVLESIDFQLIANLHKNNLLPDYRRHTDVVRKGGTQPKRLSSRILWHCPCDCQW